jgi:hypothetical protein
MIMKRTQFKMFARNIVEAIDRETLDKYYAKSKRSDEEVAKLSEPDFSNFEDSFRIGKSLVFDNKNGLGATPNNANVLYRGFVLMMTLDQFLSLAANHRGQREETANDLVGIMKEGYGISSPTLYLDFDEDTNIPFVEGHEGRGRCLAIIKMIDAGYLGDLTKDVKIPVHMILGGGLRARSIDEEKINAVRKGIVPEDDKRDLKNATRISGFSEMYLQSRKIEL